MPKPQYEDRFTVKASCGVCKTCWIDPQHGRCMHGGPYMGYRKIEDRSKKE